MNSIAWKKSLDSKLQGVGQKASWRWSWPGAHSVKAFLCGLKEAFVLKAQTLQHVQQAAVVHRILVFCRGGKKPGQVSGKQNRRKRWGLEWSALPGDSSRVRSASITVCSIPSVNLSSLLIMLKPFHMYIISCKGSHLARRQTTSRGRRLSCPALRFTSTGTGSLMGWGAL